MVDEYGIIGPLTQLRVVLPLMSEPTDRYQCSPEVLFQEVNGEIVLLDLEAETYFGLNESGAVVWQLLQKELNVEQIIEHLLSEFDVTPETAGKDVRELLEQLEKAQLVRPL